MQVSEIEWQHTIVATAQTLPEIAVDVPLLYTSIYMHAVAKHSSYISYMHDSLNRCKTLTEC